MIGPNDTVPIPRNSKKTDWQVELGVVVGRRARYGALEQASDYIAGYALVNDVSERVPTRKTGPVVQGEELRNIQSSWTLPRDPR